MSGMSEEQIAEISDVFALFDNKGDNKIAASQLGDCLRALNQNPNESEIKKCGYSGNPDARISFEVFLPILQTISRNRDHHTAEDFIEGFRMFDNDQNGFVSCAELRHILTCLVWKDLLGENGLMINNLPKEKIHRFVYCISKAFAGDKLTDEEVDMLIQGLEDAQGNINYEEFVHAVLAG